MTRALEQRSAWIIAHPVGHSLSPVMHNAAFAATGFAARYAALDVAPAALTQVFGRLRGADALGANVSLPHKQAEARLVDELAPEAAALGAVNTVVNQAGVLLGSNTDVGGFLDGLLELAPELGPGGFTALVLGAGGAARAVVWGLVGLGAEVVIVNRDAVRAGELVSRLETAGLRRGRALAATADKIEPGAFDLVVNTTTVGMAGGPAATALPLLERSQLERLRGGAVVSDLVYRPAVTPLLAAAAEVGLRRQNGVAMLVGQGARSFEAWTGLPAPVAVMRAAVEEALAG